MRRRAAVIGLAIGGFVGFAAGDDCSEEDWVCFPRSETAMGGAALGVTIGYVIGLIAGGGERWKETAIPRVSVVPTGERSIAISSTSDSEATGDSDSRSEHPLHRRASPSFRKRLSRRIIRRAGRDAAAGIRADAA